MRVAATTEVLGHGVRAPSTLGTFLRSFTWDMSPSWTACSTSRSAVHGGRCRARAGPVTLDVDRRSVRPTGLKSKVPASVTPVGVAITHSCDGCRHRRGRGCALRAATPYRSGVAGFLTQVFNVCAGGGNRAMVLRADSGFYSSKVTETCAKAG